MANETQALRWNGDTAQRWIAQRDRHAAIRHRLAPHLLTAAALSRGARVLDVGCGCGETTVAAARAVAPEGTVLGLDLSGPMLRVARRLATEAALTSISFVQADAQVHPLPPAHHDVVISSFGVMFFDDPAAAFANIRNTLRPGGRLAFLCWQHELRNDVFAIPLRAFLAHTTLPGITSDELFADHRRVAGLLTTAGFTNIRVAAVREPARLGSGVADVLRYVRHTSRVRELMARLDDEVLAGRVLAAMADQFTARQRRDGVWVEAAAWLVTAARPGHAAPGGR